MAERFEFDFSPSNRLAKGAIEELLAFERNEATFRKRERQQRAKELGIPLDTVDFH